MAINTQAVDVRKCATCRFWGCDERRITFNKNVPAYVNSPAGDSPCLAQNNKTSRAVDHCVKWMLWEKLG